MSWDTQLITVKAGVDTVTAVLVNIRYFDILYQQYFPESVAKGSF